MFWMNVWPAFSVAFVQAAAVVRARDLEELALSIATDRTLRDALLLTRAHRRRDHREVQRVKQTPRCRRLP